MRNLLLVLMVVLFVISPVSALVKVSDTPQTPATTLEDIKSLTTNIYDGAMACTTISQNGYFFVVSPVEIVKVPSNHPVDISGKPHPLEICVELWAVYRDQAEFVRDITFCYRQFGSRQHQRYNLHFRKNQKYQVRIYHLEDDGRKKLIINNWFFQTLESDTPNSLDE